VVYPVGCSEIRVDAPMPLVVVNEGRRRATVGAAEDASVVAALRAFVHFYIVCMLILFCVGTSFSGREVGCVELEADFDGLLEREET
jgi:hypothetical protein